MSVRELDDRVHRYSPRWIESAGTDLKIHIRYSAYLTFVALLGLALPFAVGAWAVGLLSAPVTVFGAVVACSAATIWIMGQVEKDLTVRGVLETSRNEFATQAEVIFDRVVEWRESRPVTFRSLR